MFDINSLVLMFLVAIQGVESNHGRDLAHRTITSESSMHFGDTAIGSYAVMPNTILMLKRDPERFKQDPIYEIKVVKQYALKLLVKAQGCPTLASILWLRGPGLKPTVLDYTSTRYKRFVKEWEAISGYSLDKDPVIRRYCR